MRVDLSNFYSLKDANARAKFLDDIIEKSNREDRPIYISPLLEEHERSEPLLHVLRLDEAVDSKYKIQVLCDEWGNKVYQGDIVKRKFKKSLKREGTPIPAREINRWKRMGIYEQKRYKYTNYKVDSKGCIEVNIIDLEYFLTQFGIHKDTGYPISYHPGPNSIEPVKAPNGQYMHVHYYRMQEVTKDDYEKLPRVGKRPEGELRRGIDAVPEKETKVSDESGSASV